MADISKNTETQIPTEEDKKHLSEAKKRLLIFWLRMIGWICTGVVAPITTFTIKFGLFTKYGYNLVTDELGNVTGMKIALNGWGIISIVLIALAIFEVINEVIAAQGEGYSYTKQLLLGFKSRCLPLAIATGVAFWLNGCLEQVQFCLIVILISQTAAMALNPLPAWRASKHNKEDYSDLISGLTKIVKEHKENK